MVSPIHDREPIEDLAMQYVIAMSVHDIVTTTQLYARIFRRIGNERTDEAIERARQIIRIVL